MRKFMLMHIGFEPPTPEVMQAWNEWFESVADCAVEHGGLGAGREITMDGVTELTFGADSMTGYSIIEAASMDDAQALAQSNPFVKAIRIFELRNH